MLMVSSFMAIGPVEACGARPPHCREASLPTRNLRQGYAMGKRVRGAGPHPPVECCEKATMAPGAASLLPRRIAAKGALSAHRPDRFRARLRLSFRIDEECLTVS